MSKNCDTVRLDGGWTWRLPQECQAPSAGNSRHTRGTLGTLGTLLTEQRVSSGQDFKSAKGANSGTWHSSGLLSPDDEQFLSDGGLR